jgi:chitin deacetylase
MIEGAVLMVASAVLVMGGLLIWNRWAGRAASRLRRIARATTLSLVAIAVVSVSAYKLVNARGYQLFGRVVDRVNTTEPVVALTFDDGPNPPYTEQLLATLRDRGVKATFFVIGGNVEKHPELAARIVSEGHELGNHSFSHDRMVLKSYPFIKEEVDRTDKLIRRTGYSGQINFRSPYSKKFILLPLYLSRVGKDNILFDVEPDSYSDVASSADRIVDYVAENAHPGSIILLHAENASRRESLEAVGGVIDALKARGFIFVTVSALLESNDGDRANESRHRSSADSFPAPTANVSPQEVIDEDSIGQGKLFSFATPARSRVHYT